MNHKYQSLLASALLYRELGRAVAYPTSVLVGELRSGEFVAGLRQVSRLLSKNGSLLAAVGEVESAVRQLEADQVGLEEEHTYLFNRQVQTSLYEGSYGPERVHRRLRSIEELASLYAAFGYRVGGGQRELPDHGGVELEFMSLLCAKEVYALDNGLTAAAGVCRDARHNLLSNHLAGWFPLFVEKLRSTARIGFYLAVAGAALALIEQQCEELGIQADIITRDDGARESLLEAREPENFDCAVQPAAQ